MSSFYLHFSTADVCSQLIMTYDETKSGSSDGAMSSENEKGYKEVNEQGRDAGSVDFPEGGLRAWSVVLGV